jgi:peptidyl-tRNA hydrolase
MPVGKVAAQVGHAIQYMMEDINNLMYIDEWQKSSTKIVLGVPSLDVMNDIIKKADQVYTVTDEGRTCVEPNMLTVACLAPLPRSIAKPFVSHLRLLK